MSFVNIDMHNYHVEMNVYWIKKSYYICRCASI